MNKKLSGKIIERLTFYHDILVDFKERNVEYISSPQISSLLNIDGSQVRKDFKLLNKTGRCRVGYKVDELKVSIEKTLGFELKREAFIIGAGNLGFALAKYDNFANYGLNILALFDNDPLKVDMKIADKQIFHISKLPNLAYRLNVEIAILTTPRREAQKTADFLVSSGIKYIWNFSPAVLQVPDGVKVWNENLIANFIQFACNDIE